MTSTFTAAHRATNTQAAGPSLDSYWMPCTGNRQFKAHPRLITRAKGCYYRDSEGREVFDGLSGLWCSGLGHGYESIIQAVQKQLGALDYSPAFQYGHPLAFELAQRVSEKMPQGLDRVFFTGSGSEATETSLKMARAYWRLKGQAGKTRLIGRMRARHGVNYGGLSVGGAVGHRKLFGQGLEVDHLQHTQPPAGSFFKGMPEYGAALADELLQLIALHDASTIAAVIVEPFSGSAGVIVPPAGYLQRLREICTKHNILLIFDEVITGFGRTGYWTASQAFGVTPDIINLAKQITNGVQPLGAVVAKRKIYDEFMGSDCPEHMPEFPHGYTYSAHPVACSAALASIEALEQVDAMSMIQMLAPLFEDRVHTLRGAANVIDIRNFGLAAGLTLASKEAQPVRRSYDVAMALFQKGFYVRNEGDTIQLAPPFVSTEVEIDRLVSALGDTLNEFS